jgi:hypothetical protein
MLISGSTDRIGIGKALIWAGLTIGGFILAIFSTSWMGIIDHHPDDPPLNYPLVLFVGGTIGGAATDFVVGLFEGALLSGWLSLRRIWIWASVAGWALGIGVWWFIEGASIAFYEDCLNCHPDPMTSTIIGYLGITLCILCLLVVQGLFLRSRAYHVGRWFVFGGLGWIAGAIVYLAIGEIVSALGIDTYLVLYAIFLLPGIGGFATALAFNVLAPRENKQQI